MAYTIYSKQDKKKDYYKKFKKFQAFVQASTNTN